MRSTQQRHSLVSIYDHYVFLAWAFKHLSVSTDKKIWHCVDTSKEIRKIPPTVTDLQLASVGFIGCKAPIYFLYTTRWLRGNCFGLLARKIRRRLNPSVAEVPMAYIAPRYVGLFCTCIAHLLELRKCANP